MNTMSKQATTIRQKEEIEVCVAVEVSIKVSKRK